MPFAQDTFTDTAGDRIDTQHTPEIGTWTKHGSTSSGQHHVVISDANRARGDTSQASRLLIYYQAAPAAAEYDVQADTVNLSTHEMYAGVAGRLDTAAHTGYLLFQDNRGSDVVRLAKVVAGTVTSLGTFANSANATIKLEIRDAAKKGFVDGVERISSSDNEITAAGRPGLYMETPSSTAPSNTNGIHLDNFQADNVGGGGGATVHPHFYHRMMAAA